MREIIEQIKLWVLHKLEIHCHDCEFHCENCERLYTLLEKDRADRKMLLDMILHKTEEITLTDDNSEPILLPDRNIPWRVRREMLEKKDREEFRNSKTVKEN